MSAAQQFLNQQLAMLRSMQNDIEFFKRQQEEKKANIEAAKKLAAQKQSEKRKQARLAGLPPEDPRKRVKAILKARREKQVVEQLKYEGPVLPIRVGGPDLNGKVKVRLDSRTEVWAKPGYNIDELKAKYLRRHNDIIPVNENSETKAFRKQKEILPGEIYELVRLGEQ